MVVVLVEDVLAGPWLNANTPERGFPFHHSAKDKLDRSDLIHRAGLAGLDSSFYQSSNHQALSSLRMLISPWAEHAFLGPSREPKSTRPGRTVCRRMSALRTQFGVRRGDCPFQDCPFQAWSTSI
jgi:hypothetical protein